MRQGIFCVVEVKGANIGYHQNHNFWLPRNTFEASRKLSELLNAHKRQNPQIPDALLDKKVTFHIKGLEHVNIGFLQIIAGLMKTKVNVEILTGDDNVV